jgi:hypothetical protein
MSADYGSDDQRVRPASSGFLRITVTVDQKNVERHVGNEVDFEMTADDILVCWPFHRCTCTIKSLQCVFYADANGEPA